MNHSVIGASSTAEELEAEAKRCWESCSVAVSRAFPVVAFATSSSRVLLAPLVGGNGGKTAGCAAASVITGAGANSDDSTFANAGAVVELEPAAGNSGCGRP